MNIEIVEEGEVNAALARVPPAWTQVARGEDGAAFRRGTLQAILSVERHDGALWLHVSACGRTGERRFYLPSWEEMKRVKQDFLGDVWAYGVLPPAKDYVNDHPSVLHLFARMDGASALPDFTRGTGTL